MTNNDLYVRMCKDHPIQKQWKPHSGDRYYRPKEDAVRHNCRGCDTILDFEKEECVWLPRQEDWQEKYKGVVYVSDLESFENNYEDIPTQADISNNSQYFTILWCLFVSREVYGLEWSWEESKWVKN